MSRSFSEADRENIKNKLKDACTRSWTRYGYKKTSVDELCEQAGISKGAFYLFFESKESLFCEVICETQQKIYDAATKIMEEHMNKEGVSEALKLIYREYDRNNFLYESNNADFHIFMNRLSKEQAEKIEESGNMSRKLFADKSYLKFRIDENLAVSVIYSLIMNIKNKNFMPYDHLQTFDFMVENLVDDLYE